MLIQRQLLSTSNYLHIKQILSKNGQRILLLRDIQRDFGAVVTIWTRITPGTGIEADVRVYTFK